MMPAPLPGPCPWPTMRLAIAAGVAYFLAAQLSLALLAKSDGLAMFWVAGGVSSGVLIVFGRNARWPVAGSVMVATIIATAVLYLCTKRLSVVPLLFRDALGDGQLERFHGFGS